MIHRTLLMAFIMTTITSAQTTRPAAFIAKLDAGQPQKIVFYGTSLTHQGAWSKQVMAVLDAKYPKLITTVNAAQSGQQSRWGIQNVKARVIEHKPDVVFVEFTTNDAVRRFKLSVEEARQNTEGMIEQIQAANPNCQVILMTMNPMIIPDTSPERQRIDLPAYEQMYREVALEHGLLLVDNAAAWKTLYDQGETAFKKMVPDGVHPSADGFAKYVTPNVLKAIGHVSSDRSDNLGKHGR